MSDRLEFEDGKYTVVDELFEGGGFYALRHGESWRSLAGDKLVYSMFCEILELREELVQVDRERRKWAGSTNFGR